MKYFTPELIVAYGSDDPQTWKEAEKRWEDACTRYNAHLASIRGELPPGLGSLEENYRLHDAVIRGMGRRGGTFVILLQLDAPPQSLLSCTYSLVDEPAIRHGVLPVAHCGSGGQVDWQYDEVEQVAGQPPTWRQTLLLSNGWEVALHFHDVRVEEIQPLLPAPRNSADPCRRPVCRNQPDGAGSPPSYGTDGAEAHPAHEADLSQSRGRRLHRFIVARQCVQCGAMKPGSAACHDATTSPARRTSSFLATWSSSPA